ncbi:uncharacterized protein [Nicotiana tomentosiformis]|uniref:uncharacterized protein n=1 Tax=Nicotiana tomentosiformis TaxID=4098 RepID=UPI00388C8CBA
MDTAISNINGKIWLFLDSVVQWDLLELWDRLYYLASDMELPWLVGRILMKKLQLKRIQNHDGNWIESQEQIANAAVEFFQKQFTHEADYTSSELLNNVPSMVSCDQNIELYRIPTIEEVKAAVFALSGETASGPDSFTCIFFQECWDIIGEDIHEMLKLFYGGSSLPKFITHTNLVLLTKKQQVQTFNDLRPISLRNFDIVTNIRLRGKPANVVIKLDMAKAYDRVSWKSIGTITGFSMGEFPFTYLGCPIFYTRRRKDYYNDLIKTVKAKLHSWKGKLLSYGGKATLISSVLQSMPTHILSVIDLPKNVLEHLHKTFARFFWSNKEEGRSRHWTKWKNLCLPKEEGGVGFRSLHDVSKTLFAKLWWTFRTSKSLWSNFMWNNYYKK